MAGVPEQSFFAQPFSGPRGTIVSPFQFTTTGEDNLRIVSVNSLTGVEVRVAGRRFDSRGTLVPLDLRHTPNTDRTTATEDFALGAGALVNVDVRASAGSPIIGQTFVMVQLIRGLGGATIVLGTLLAGYVTATQGLAWPGTPVIASTAGEPPVRSITGTAPAAGVNWLETVPTGARWEILSIRVNLTTSVAVGNRFPRVLAATGGADRWEVIHSTSQGANQSAWWLWAQGIETIVDATNFFWTGAIPRQAILPSGSTIRSFTTGLLAGDQYSAPAFMVREWLEVP